MDSFEKENLLHLNEPLLRKENQYYIVNIKPEVIRKKKNLQILVSFISLSSLQLCMKFHVFIKYQT